MGEDYYSPFQKTWTTGTKVLAFEKSGLKTFRPERKSFCTYVMKRNTYINKKTWVNNDELSIIFLLNNESVTPEG